MLKRLQDATGHVCEFIGCGRNDKVNYVVMTLLGPSLSELRKRQHHQRFSHSTVLRVGVQIITAIRSIHNCGFLHRDVKPSNFAIGATPGTSRTCFMLDFGLSRQYTTLTGEVRQPRTVAGFRGTVRYASLNAHLAHDLGRHDDLWSVFYMLVELAVGQLPWRRIRDKEEAGEVKAQYDHRKLIKTMPYEFFNFLSHLKDLTYFQKPDYAMLIKLFQCSMKRLGIHDSDPYDWEQDYSAPSLTTASAGSPPAVKIIEQNELVKEGVDGKRRDDAPSSKTNCSEVADLSENGQNAPPVQISPGPIDQSPKASDNDMNIKESPNKSTEKDDRRNGVQNDIGQLDQPDGEKVISEIKVINPPQLAKQVEAENEENGNGIGLSEKLEIENRYESEGETSSTETSTSDSMEEEKEEGRKPAMEAEAARLNESHWAQPNIPLPLMDGCDFEPLHRYGSITPMKSIHTDSLNRFFDMGPHQNNIIGSSETIGNRCPTHSQSREQEKEVSDSDKNQSSSSSSTSYSSCQEHLSPVEAEIHPESGPAPNQGYTGTNESSNRQVDEVDKLNQGPPIVNDHVTSTLVVEDHVEVDLLQPPRVVQLMTNGLQDSDSSRSVQIAAATITVKETKFNDNIIRDPPIEQIDHLDTQMEPSANKSELDTQANIAKQTEFLTADVQLHVPPSDDNKPLPATAAILRTPTKGSGRKLPAIPGSRTNTASTLTSKASPPLQNIPSPPHLPTTPTPPPHSSNEPAKQDVQVLLPAVSSSGPLAPRPPPNPPPANYSANVLARRRRFIRSQPK